MVVCGLCVAVHVLRLCIALAGLSDVVAAMMSCGSVVGVLWCVCGAVDRRWVR